VIPSWIAIGLNQGSLSKLIVSAFFVFKAWFHGDERIWSFVVRQWILNPHSIINLKEESNVLSRLMLFN